MNNSVEKTAAVANVSAAPVKEESGIASPWVTCYRKIKAMFEQDAEVEVTAINGKEGEYDITITSTNKYKIEAIKKLVRPQIKYGNITVNINCVVNTGDRTDTIASDFATAFNNNPFVSKIIKAPYGPDQSSALFILMRHDVVQFYNDNVCDYNGNSSFLSEDIAREIFNTPELGAINIGTDTKD